MTNTAAGKLIRWEIQRYHRQTKVWSTEPSGMVGDHVDERQLALACLAAFLMTVDHDNDLDDFRSVVRCGMRPASAIVTVDDLEAYLGQRGYYRGGRPALRTVLDKDACDELPEWLRGEVDRVGPPRSADPSRVPAFSAWARAADTAAAGY